MPKETDILRQQLNTIQEQFSSVEQAYQDLQVSFSQLQTVYEFAFSVSNTLELEELLKTVKRQLKKLDIDSFALLLQESDPAAWKVASSFGLIKPSATAALESYWHNRLAKSGPATHIYLEDTSSQKLLPHKSPSSSLYLPMLSESSGQASVMVLIRGRARAFSEHDVNMFVRLSRLFQVVLDKILVHERTRALSLKDDLTGLYNRRFFNQAYESEWQRCQRYNRSLAILMIDIDNFKHYNDTHGHLMGDAVLKNVARVLQTILRKSDILARYGGEEFVILLPESSGEQAKQAAAKLRHAIEVEPFAHENQQPDGRLTVSIGVAGFPEDTADKDELLRLSDKALYLAKKAGKNCVAWGARRQEVEHGTTSPAKSRKLKKKSMSQTST